jgi:DNA repair protein RadA/Sms
MKWVGRCGECQQWGTVQEAGMTAKAAARRVQSLAPTSAARPITQISTGDSPRRKSGVGEFDRVLGGGIVPGAAILLSGEPGVGKSTLLLEVAARAAKEGRRVLYVSAEESVAQVGCAPSAPTRCTTSCSSRARWISRRCWVISTRSSPSW